VIDADVVDDAGLADGPDVEVSAGAWADLVKRHGEKIRVFEMAGRRWVLRCPKRAEWLECKVAKASPDINTAVMATTMLARRCLAPYDPAGTVAAEREAFDKLCDEYPAVGDILGAAVEALALGPLDVRGVRVAPSSPLPVATPTAPQTP